MPRVRRSENSAKKSCHSIASSNDEEPGTPPPQQRNAANARERARMRVLSRAFCRLKTTLPWVPADTKLSKLDTLRLATSYIAHLRDSLLTPAAAAAAAAAAASATATATAATRQPIGTIGIGPRPQSPPGPTPHTNGAMWPLNFQAKLPEPWLSRRTHMNGAAAAGAGNPSVGPGPGPMRGPLCPGTPLDLPPEHCGHGVPPSPPSSSGEEDDTDNDMPLDQPWQMMRLCSRGCE